MDCFIGRTDFRIEEPTVVTIGKFDGRHKGHQKLLGRMLELKRQKGYRAAVFTFDTAPMAKLSGTDQKVITTNQERRNNMAKMGIDYLVEYPFTRDVVHLSAGRGICQGDPDRKDERQGHGSGNRLRVWVSEVGKRPGPERAVVQIWV